MKPRTFVVAFAVALAACSRAAPDHGGNATVANAGTTMNDAVRTVDEANAKAFGAAGTALDHSGGSTEGAAAKPGQARRSADPTSR